jgi:hypothetical protein
MQTPAIDIPTILPALLAMPRADKLSVINALTTDLEREALESLLEDIPACEFWSPHDSYDAAEKLSAMLNHKKVIHRV